MTTEQQDLPLVGRHWTSFLTQDMMTYIRSELGENDSTPNLGQVDTLQTFSIRDNQFAALQPAQVGLEHDFWIFDSSS